MKASTTRTFTVVHTWTGLLAGFALFIAFYAGALTMFHDEIDTWASPRAEMARADTMDRAGKMLEGIVATHPGARDQIGVTFPADHPSHEVAAYWMDKSGDWKPRRWMRAARATRKITSTRSPTSSTSCITTSASRRSAST